ncbi:MAG: hypothetical protein HY011_23595 [Acidobacteria bacterium]|nr:hypothetical protein [Acidobacteriota bacterium]
MTKIKKSVPTVADRNRQVVTEINNTQAITAPRATGIKIPQVITAPQWYNRTDGIFGNLPIHYIASVIYASIALAPAALYLLFGSELGTGLKNLWWAKLLGLIWALIVSVALPTWSWLEARAFERWLIDKEFDLDTCKIERDYFKLMNDSAKNFWAGVLAIYTLAGIWGLVLK